MRAAYNHAILAEEELLGAGEARLGIITGQKEYIRPPALTRQYWISPIEINAASAGSGFSRINAAITGIANVTDGHRTASGILVIHIYFDSQHMVHASLKSRPPLRGSMDADVTQAEV